MTEILNLHDFKESGIVKEIALDRDYGFVMSVINRCKSLLNMKYIGRSFKSLEKEPEGTKPDEDCEFYKSSDFGLCVCHYNDGLLGEYSVVWLRATDEKSLKDAITKLKLVYKKTMPLLPVILDDCWFNAQITNVFIKKIPANCRDILCVYRDKIVAGEPKRGMIIQCQRALIDAGFKGNAVL